MRSQHTLRRLLGVGDATIPAVTGPARDVRIGAGDMLAWGARSALVVAVIRVDARRDVCIVDNGRDRYPVVFDGHLLHPMQTCGTGRDRNGETVGSGSVDGTPVTTMIGRGCVIARIGDDTWIAERDTPATPAHWVNALGHPNPTALCAPNPPLGGPR